VLRKLVYLTLCRIIQLLALRGRGDAAKDLEILVLRHQLAVLRRQLPRPKLEPADRALLAAISRRLPRSSWSCFLVKPETLLRWHRRLVAGAWTYPHRRPGRPPLDEQVQQLIVRLARENPRWGYQRIKGELLRLGMSVSVTAIRTVLSRHGLGPAPRRTAMTWRAFPPQAALVKRRGGERCGNGAPRARQVRVAKASGSEPLMRCRGSLDDIETGVVSTSCSGMSLAGACRLARWCPA